MDIITKEQRQKNMQHIRAKDFKAEYWGNGQDGYTDAAGGFFVILSDGQKKTFKSATHDSRIAVGFDAAYDYMYILGVEGEFSKESVGLSYPECADIFLMLGCTNAMQADGGASSQLVVAGKNLIPSPYTPIQANTLGIKLAQ